MRKDVFTLVSKAQLEFRQLMLNEENILTKAANQRSDKQEQVLTDVLTKCCTNVVDPGPYMFLSEGGHPNWKKMANGDRVDAMVKLRCLSYKDGNEMEIEGLECPACEKSIDLYTVDLNKDLYRREFPDETLEAIKKGEPLVMDWGGDKVFYNIPTGATSEYFAKLSDEHPDRPMTCLLRSRIVKVEGVENRDLMDWLDGNWGAEKRNTKYQGHSSEECEELRDKLDEANGGIDTEFTADCPRSFCGARFRARVPFNQASFFLPGKGIQRRRLERRRLREEEEAQEQVEKKEKDQPPGQESSEG